MLTEADLKRRKSFLTASDVPAVLGISPFRTPLMVWADKTGQSQPFEGNDATTFGDDFEGALIARAARLLNLQNVVPNQWKEHKNGLLAATLDATAETVSGMGVDVECKTSGIINPGADLDAWGETGTKAVPDYVAVQMQTQMACGELPLGVCSALLGRGKGHRLYTLPFDPESMKWIEDFCMKWWDRHMLGGHAPEATSPADNDVVRYFKRVDTKTVTIDPLLASQWEEAWAIADAHKEKADTLDAAIKLALGDAGMGLSGTRTFKYLEEGAADKVDLKGLRAAHPDIYASFATKNTRRVLRLTKAGK